MDYLLPGPTSKNNLHDLENFIDKLLDSPKFKKLIVESLNKRIKPINENKKKYIEEEELPPEFYNNPIKFIFENISDTERKVLVREINRKYGE